jgi:hypothetical protein
MLGLCAARPLLGVARPSLRARALHTRLPAYAYTRPTVLSCHPLSTSPTVRNDARPASIRDDVKDRADLDFTEIIWEIFDCDVSGSPCV